MTFPVRRTLADLTPGEPLHHGALTVVPLLAPAASDPDWLTLAEAGDAVLITEVSETGEVPFLKVVNDADRAVLLLDGEELVGAKQNRVLNTTVLVAARASVVIPVSCVERGRWAWRGRRFAASDVSLFASARRAKAAQVTDLLHRTGRHLSDQREVWDAVSERAARVEAESATEAMHEVYERHRGAVAEAREALAPRPGQVGAIVYLAGAWAGFEVLAGPRLFERAWPRLAAGYVADALGVRPRKRLTPPFADVVDLLMRSPVEPAPSVGLGEEHRVAGGKAVGAALVAEGRVAHLMAFPTPAGLCPGG